MDNSKDMDSKEEWNVKDETTKKKQRQDIKNL